MYQYRASYERRRAETRRQMAEVAERVADGWSISAAGRDIGVSQQRASQIFAQIRSELGWQAQ